MVTFDDALQDWLKTVQSLGDITPGEQSRITKAGAEVFKAELEKETRNKHYSKRNHPSRKHLADDIVVQNRNIDGRLNGASTVGWESKMNATIARWQNDGTRKMRGDHFVTNLQQSPKILEKVLEAEKAEYKKIMRKRGG